VHVTENPTSTPKREPVEERGRGTQRRKREGERDTLKNKQRCKVYLEEL
jgi:hypothetical protein